MQYHFTLSTKLIPFKLIFTLNFENLILLFFELLECSFTLFIYKDFDHNGVFIIFLWQNSDARTEASQHLDIYRSKIRDTDWGALT